LIGLFITTALRAGGFAFWVADAVLASLPCRQNGGGVAAKVFYNVA